MKILTPENTRKADAYTIEHEPIKSIDLMERASSAFVSTFMKYFSADSQVSIFSGTGNNGGDGLAVGRLLTEKGFEVRAYVINPGESQGSEDFEINFRRLVPKHPVGIIKQVDDFPILPEGSVLIDALFGSGLTRPVEGVYAAILVKMNGHPGKKVSIDIASGLFADQARSDGAVFEPDLTITFQMPKLAFMIPENEPYIGKLEIADIGLDKNYIDQLESDNFFIDRSVIGRRMKPRKKFSHKGKYGRAAILSGSLGKMGAAVLCARACLRSGVGLLTMHVPKCGYEIMQTSIPEAMTTVDKHQDLIAGIPDLSQIDVVGVGPGIGKDPLTKNMLKELLLHAPGPMVIDADAINLMGEHRELLEIVPAGSILTPHLKEFERIAGESKNHFDRLALQKEFSKKHEVIIILKGAYTAISSQDGKTFFNSTGNPGMATGGSGDVLTGMVTGFLAKGHTPEDAAMLAVYLHGLAGDLASEEKGQESMIASDIIDFLPRAMRLTEENFQVK